MSTQAVPKKAEIHKVHVKPLRICINSRDYSPTLALNKRGSSPHSTSDIKKVLIKTLRKMFKHLNDGLFFPRVREIASSNKSQGLLS